MKLLQNIFSRKPKKLSLILDQDGINYIGGKASPDIVMPELETSPMVYFGCISKNETNLEIIDFDLHLICPLFIDLQTPVFLDYSDSTKPKLIRENVPSNFSQYFEEIPNTAYIEYKKLKFSFNSLSTTKIKIGVHEIDYIPEEIGTFGQPNWIHNEDWPKCPINGKKMEFLFQLGDIDDCKMKLGKNILEKESIDPYLHFGHGYLYVFYEPKSKVVAYLNQL